MANQLRSLLAEYGFTIPVGILRFQQQVPELIEDASNSLTFTIRRLLFSLREDMQALNERITSLDVTLRGTQVLPVPARIGGRAEGLNALLKSCGWEAVSNDDHWKLVTISAG
ncbi:hypothetical protein L465_00383 [Enterobacter sp. BIDMC 29]|uniref:hypothetical protein n=1 Tax=Enterobacter sp. BIDMC 29 TaxID=1329841 RepID=UPI00044AB97F|nr:hypothetical protein [Enterobacter sp. BIDMC 29]EUM16569.1 hypothetical protein L465_00383 [Enterobacter sp. BIDMC 29]